MAFMGVGELLVLFGLLGGAVGGTTTDLQAPRDKPAKSLAWVLPEADIAAHANIEGAIRAVTSLMDEIADLRIIKDSQEFSQGMTQGKLMLGQAFEQGQRELGMDLRTDAGSVTFSMEFNEDQSFKLLLRMRGNFGKSRVKELVKQETGHSVAYKKHTLFLLPDDQETRNNVFCLADDTTVLFGDRATVETILDGKSLKAVKGSAARRLKKYVDRRAASYVYAALPRWVSAELRHDRDLVLVADLVDATDYLLYVAGARKGKLVIQAKNASAAGRYEYMLKSVASLVGIMEPAVDAFIYGVLGFVPLVSDRDLEREVRELVSNEKGMLELGKWAKKRFGGKAKVKADRRKFLTTMEMSNPMSIGAITMPVVAGAAFYAMARPFQEGIHEDDLHKEAHTKEAPEVTPVKPLPEPEDAPLDDKTNIEPGIK